MRTSLATPTPWRAAAEAGLACTPLACTRLRRPVRPRRPPAPSRILRSAGNSARRSALPSHERPGRARPGRARPRPAALVGPSSPPPASAAPSAAAPTAAPSAAAVGYAAPRRGRARTRARSRSRPHPRQARQSAWSVGQNHPAD
eukprot:scaffold40712_cov65-Phaeocystis_antarctica.AAC.1